MRSLGMATCVSMRGSTWIGVHMSGWRAVHKAVVVDCTEPCDPPHRQLRLTENNRPCGKSWIAAARGVGQHAPSSGAEERPRSGRFLRQQSPPFTLSLLLEIGWTQSELGACRGNTMGGIGELVGGGEAKRRDGRGGVRTRDGGGRSQSRSSAGWEDVGRVKRFRWIQEMMGA